MCLSHVMMKDSALGKQVFILPLDTELLAYVNPKALENQGNTEDAFLVCDTDIPRFKLLIFVTPNVLSLQNLWIC